MSATPPLCPICKSTFCCCLEHLFPEQVDFYNRYKTGQAEPQVKLGPACTELENGSLLEGVATGHASVSAPGLLPKGAEPTPQTEDYQEAYTLAKTLSKKAGTGRTPQEGQTKRASLLEAASNILIGFWVSVGANMLVLPHFKNPGVFREAFLIGLIFTIISFVRSYLLRRLFNLFHIRANRRSPWKP